MQYIKSVEIHYLRSIHRIKINSAGNLTVFSGANDVGKSNILKAINLFFNNQVDWNSPFDFYRDFSLRRLNEVRQESIKGKQYIKVAVEFIRPKSYERSLPPIFTVTKSWFRDNPIPQLSDNLERQIEKEKRVGKFPQDFKQNTADRMLSQFLGKIRFEYVPAIRDRRYFEYVLDKLQETLLATQMRVDDPIMEAVRELNQNMRQRASSLRDEFHAATGILTDVSLPNDPHQLFKAFSVNTNWDSLQNSVLSEAISLGVRGDGIQARYISSLLKYIAQNSSFFHIWGFEEPENSIEYNLAIALAQRFETEYAKDVQIFTTSHSPAFIALTGKNTVSYRVFKSGNSTEISQLHPHNDTNSIVQLEEDIGLFRIQKELYKQYLERKDELERYKKEVESLKNELAITTLPVVYLEGKTDEAILRCAWKKLFNNEPMPFSLKNCDPLPATSSGGAGGTGTLSRLLNSIRDDSSCIVIGIFDRDDEGIKSYEGGKDGLTQYFREDVALQAKISENRKAAAMLLPIPSGKEDFATIKNLCIEFFFSETALSQRTPEGYGLELEQPEIEHKVKMKGAPIISIERSPFPHTRQIRNGKTIFAERIVPNLDAQEFEPMRAIFQQVEVLINSLG